MYIPYVTEKTHNKMALSELKQKHVSVISLLFNINKVVNYHILAYQSNVFITFRFIKALQKTRFYRTKNFILEKPRNKRLDTFPKAFPPKAWNVLSLDHKSTKSHSFFKKYIREDLIK